MMRTLLVGAVLLGAVGCGGGGRVDPARQAGTTYLYAVDQPITVGAGLCSSVAGPVDVNGTASMYFEIDDVSPGTDAMEVAIVADSFYAAEACNFTYAQTVFDDAFVGSKSTEGTVYADTYDFIVVCNNPGEDCVFSLTWNATY